MDIMELGAIGELVGGMAVIASLIYVGLQVRQSNAINRAESIRSFVRDYNTFLYKILENDDVMRRATVDFEGMSGSDQTKAHLLFLSQFMLGLGDSIASPDRSDTFATWIDNVVAMGLKTAPSWWSRFKGTPESLVPDYVARVEALAPELPSLHQSMPWFDPSYPEER